MKKVAIAALAVLALAGCSENANYRDLEGVPLTEPQKIEVYANLDGHPNIVRLCIDGKAFITTTRKRFAVARAADLEVERIAAALALHEPHVCTLMPFGDDPCGIMFGGGCRYEGHCRTCRTPAPCRTVKALRGESDE